METQNISFEVYGPTYVKDKNDKVVMEKHDIDEVSKSIAWNDSFVGYQLDLQKFNFHELENDWFREKITDDEHTIHIGFKLSYQLWIS